jgi:hypothetical protein
VYRRPPLPGERSQRDQTAAWEAAAMASGLPLVGLDGPGGRPRLAPAAALAAGIAGEAELMDLWLTDRRPRWEVWTAIAAVLPAGHVLVDAYDVWLGEPPLPGQVLASVYRATVDLGAVDVGQLRAAVRSLVEAMTLPRDRRKGDATVPYDLRPFIEHVEAVPDAEAGVAIRMTLRHDPERGIGRPEELLAELSDRLGVRLEPPLLVGIVRERLVLAADRRAG